MDQNQNDYRVVTFHNKTELDFTPEVGAMYDSRPIFGTSGQPCIKAGESIVLPYHVGRLLAKNLAKLVMTKQAPIADAAGIPTGVPLWDENKLETLRMSFLTDLYTEEKPAPANETDRLMAKVEEYKALVEKLIPGATETKESVGDLESSETPSTFSDKAEVIAELKKREITFDARKSKAELEKLIV